MGSDRKSVKGRYLALARAIGGKGACLLPDERRDTWTSSRTSAHAGVGVSRLRSQLGDGEASWTLQASNYAISEEGMWSNT